VDDSEKKRALELVNHLEAAGMNCGLLVVRGAIALRCPGAPYSDSPMMTFNETDLQNAVALNLLEKQRMVTDSFPPEASHDWEWYVVTRTARRASR
jgi:hypothetical protein